MMELKRGQELALEIVHSLEPFCHQIEVVGSIRRCKPQVGDIDIILIRRDPWAVSTMIQEWGAPIVHGTKIERVKYKGVNVDFYFASRETWATLLLIRTGSKENNIRLCSYAKEHYMKLRADGSGLFKINPDCEADFERPIVCNSELQIYQALGLPYQRPEERG
jgi:DNA polymerase (family 10)